MPTQRRTLSEEGGRGQPISQARMRPVNSIRLGQPVQCRGPKYHCSINMRTRLHPPVCPNHGRSSSASKPLVSRLSGTSHLQLGAHMQAFVDVEIPVRPWVLADVHGKIKVGQTVDMCPQSCPWHVRGIDEAQTNPDSLSKTPRCFGFFSTQNPSNPNPFNPGHPSVGRWSGPRLGLRWKAEASTVHRLLFGLRHRVARGVARGLRQTYPWLHTTTRRMTRKVNMTYLLNFERRYRLNIIP